MGHQWLTAGQEFMAMVKEKKNLRAEGCRGAEKTGFGAGSATAGGAQAPGQCWGAALPQNTKSQREPGAGMWLLQREGFA